MKTRIAIASAILGVLLLGVIWRCQIQGDSRRKVYAVLPLTGVTAELGQVAMKTMKMYEEENTNRLFDVIYIDAESSPQKAITAINQNIIGEDAPIVIASFSYLANAVIKPVDDKNGFTFALATYSVNESMVKDSRAYQRISASIDDVILPIANYAKKSFSRIAIIHSIDEFAMGCSTLFKRTYEDISHEVLSEVTFDITKPEVRESVARALQKNPDAIYVSGTVSAAYLNVFKTLRNMGFKGTIIADVAFANPFAYKSLGETANGIILACTVADTKITDFSKYTDYMSKFKALCDKHKIPSYMVTIQTYDNLAIVDNFLKNNIPFKQKSFEDLGSFESVAGKITFYEKGNSSYPCELAVVRNGELVILEVDHE